jgi:hypothetical protein
VNFTGYQSPVAPTAATEHWVQLDLGESVDIDRVSSCCPARDDFNGIGATASGFPVRFKVEVSERPDVPARVKLSWISLRPRSWRTVPESRRH